MKDNLRGIKAIFFDAGGTLIHLDSAHICGLITDELEAMPSPDSFRHAQYLAMSRVAELVALGTGSTENLKREFYSTLLPKIGVSESRLAGAVDCVLKTALAEMLWRKADPSTIAALDQLKQRGLTLAVVSNSDGRIERAFEQAELTSYFDFFIDSFIVGFEKPDPAIFQLAIERAGVSADEAIYVGDLYDVDVVGARSAGLLPVLYDPYHLNKNADCLTIRAISDLVPLLDNSRSLALL
ncbi:MAG: HAD-IA family hydrolase [Blastocatellia bacterium]